MNQRVTALVQKEVTRKEFLGMSGLAIASVFGFGTVVKLLTGTGSSKSVMQTQNPTGYGSSSYGGIKR